MGGSSEFWEKWLEGGEREESGNKRNETKRRTTRQDREVFAFEDNWVSMQQTYTRRLGDIASIPRRKHWSSKRGTAMHRSGGAHEAVQLSGFKCWVQRENRRHKGTRQEGYGSVLVGYGSWLDQRG